MATSKLVLARRRLNNCIQKVSPLLLSRSGAVFYTGLEGFSARYPIYVLGYNPAGDRRTLAKETIAKSVSESKGRSDVRWSAFRDESWKDCSPGCERFQCRVTTLFWRVGLNIREIASSNLIFERSNKPKDLKKPKELVDLCWPVHKQVLMELRVKVIVCLGVETARRVRSQLTCAQVQEINEVAPWPNAQKPRVQIYSCAENVLVLQLPHPSRSLWTCHGQDASSWVSSVFDRYHIV